MDASREIQGNIHLCVNSIFNVSRILGTYHSPFTLALFCLFVCFGCCPTEFAYTNEMPVLNEKPVLNQN